MAWVRYSEPHTARKRPERHPPPAKILKCSTTPLKLATQLQKKSFATELGGKAEVIRSPYFCLLVTLRRHFQETKPTTCLTGLVIASGNNVTFRHRPLTL